MSEILEKPYCRTCMSKDFETFVSLYDNDMWVILKDLTSIEISDQFSKMICQICKTTMLSFIQFKNKCWEVDSLLKSIKIEMKESKKIIVDPCITDDFNWAVDTEIFAKEENGDIVDDPNHNMKIKIKKERKTKVAAKKDTSNKEMVKLNIKVSVCIHCTKIYANRKKLKEHIAQAHQTNSKDDSSRKKCTYCKKTFPSLFSLSKHFKMDHKKYKPTRKCEKCDKNFYIDEQLKLHFNKMHLETNCHVCNKVVRGLYTLQTHLKNHASKLLSVRRKDAPEEETVLAEVKDDILNSHINKKVANNELQTTFKCRECPKTFSDKRWLKRHARRHEMENPFTCTYCQKVFYEVHLLNGHVRESHENVAQLKCEKCTQLFFVEAALEKHIQRSHPNTSCEHCSKQCKSLKSLRSHIRLVHSITISVRCQLCDKEFKHQKSLKAHMDRHKGLDRSRICSICGLKVSNLNNHMYRTHKTGRYTFTCRRCGQQFTDEKDLRDHRKERHPIRERAPEEYQYQCTQCGKKLLTQANLNSHMKKKHLNSKIYRCNICNAETKIKQSFKRHMIGHSDERKFACDFCGKKFFHSYLMMRHRRTHTGETPYNCVICHRKFVHYNSYAAHRKTHFS